MFPLEFPMQVLSRESRSDSKVLDPFCGRGTTNMAARLRGLPNVGIDSHPLAVALTEAKLVSTCPRDISRELDNILSRSCSASEAPTGEFWELAFEESTLAKISRIRDELLQDCRSPARVALRAILLGALHGPTSKGEPSYFSNQFPRTFAPKPRYAVKFWRDHDMRPQEVDIRSVVERRSHRYYAEIPPPVSSLVLLGDSREEAVFQENLKDHSFDWVITSPPYYGLRTYRPDQWLRLWFLGGINTVDYSQQEQITHESPDSFMDQLSRVWKNCASVCPSGARLIIRFGQISDRTISAFEILRGSLSNTSWRIQTRCDAGSASLGKRQADHFGIRSTAQREFDLWAIKS